MAYSAEISRRNPTAILFVIDQSGSMNDNWSSEITKAQALSDAINRLLAEIVTKCSKEDGVRHYFDVGVIAYGDAGSRDALAFIPGPLLKAAPTIEQTPLRVDDRKRLVPDGAGGVVERTVKFPIWFDPCASGSTPMCSALAMAGDAVGNWAEQHRSAFPPTVIHVTDGEPTDGDPEPIAQMIQQLNTDDGDVLLFNLHIAGLGGQKVLFPASEAEVPSAPAAQKLFRMSSKVPGYMLECAQSQGHSIKPGARGYGYNADFVETIAFLSIGTQATNLGR